MFMVKFVRKMWSKIFYFLLLVTLLMDDALSRQVNSTHGSFKVRRRRGEPVCTLPAQPANGRYKVTGGSVSDGKAMFINLEFSCNPSFVLDGDANAFCYGGEWNELPRCVQTCRLMRHRSVHYNCIISGTDQTRPCRDAELEGAVVQPACRRPHYYTPIELPYMTCRRGNWNAWPTCIPECGLLNPGSGSGALRSIIPWHAAIYNKNILAATHEHICSGSLISNSVILSAAHCFWDESTRAVKAETNFAVAVGKTYSDWQHADDEQYAQRSDVKKIVVPKGYRGADGGQQDDIAVVVVSRGFEYQHHVRPVCLDFKRDMLDKQLVVGNHGKTALWGTGDQASGAKALQAIDMPFVSRDDCTTSSGAGDKLCAGNANGTGLCGPDSGSGLVFAATIQNTTRYYLRGVASAGTGPNACSTHTAFTTIMKYQALIKTYWFL